MSAPLRTLERNPRAAAQTAFTLIEMLVVMGIIVIIIAFAMPAFRFLSGTRSVEAGQNTLASMLSTARAEAVGVQQPRGVAIYREALTGRMAAALVEYKAAAPWVSATDYVYGDFVTAGATCYMCLLPVNSTTMPATDTAHWKTVGAVSAGLLTSGQPMAIDAVKDVDRVLLPAGIDCRGAGDQTANSLRYLNPTVILFDGSGLVTSRVYYLIRDGIIGPQLDSSTIVPTPTPLATDPIRKTSQIGLVLFDDETFKTVAPADADGWLDSNATPVMVNRYNGTLVKGE